MTTLQSLVFSLGIVLAAANEPLVPPAPCPLNNARYLPIYDLDNVTYNVLSYDHLNSFSKDGFYQFKDVQRKTFGGMFYGDYPVLVVYQPNEKVAELHGYLFLSPWGLRTMYETSDSGADVYKTFRDYLNSPTDKEGYTPPAALQIYPEIENMKLTKIARNPDEEKVTRGATLLFLLPKNENLKPKNFDRKYNLFEQFYYNGTSICKVSAEEEEEDKSADAENLQMKSAENDEYVPLLTVYDRDPGHKGHNVADLDLVNQYFARNNFYKFRHFVKQWLPYDENPILVVFQPDEKVPQLHGYYFDEGILSLVSYVNDNPEFADEYRALFEYLEKEPEVDGLTPEAARFDYPYFLDYKLTRFTHAENVADKFAVLFLAPSRHRPASFLQKYQVLEDYGVGNKYIVKYQV